jgi:RNA exonuclease 4
VNYNGHVLMDEYVKPEGKITNFRTWVSGILPKHMEKAIPYKEARERVMKIVEGRIIIGHALKNDLRVLDLEDFSQSKIRDTS